METRAKMAENMKGNQWNIGYKHTQEAKANMAAAQRRRAPISEETRIKLQLAAKLREQLKRKSIER
jgi:hypothetical protein